jgi:LmbE family N-acetylglucosaminyl deacetylase
VKQTPLQSKKILMVFAHADDETLLAGALIAQLISEGNVVAVLCLAPGDDDRRIRMRKACEVLGVKNVETLRYAESAMWPIENLNIMGRSPNGQFEDKLSPGLTTVPIDDVAGRIAGRISELNPTVIITHAPYGDYGHADHAAAHRATVRAIEQFSSNMPLLYSLIWPKWMMWLNVWMMKIGGRDIRRMGPDGRFNFGMLLQRQQTPNLTIKVSRYLDVRREASRWYEEELARGPLPMRLLERLPLRIQSIFLGKARLVLEKCVTRSTLKKNGEQHETSLIRKAPN